MRRLIKILVFALVFAVILCACGQTGNETVPEYDTKIGESDLGGFAAT